LERISIGRRSLFTCSIKVKRRKSVPDNVRAEALREASITSLENYPGLIRDDVARTIIEDAGLIGF
jgi:hypothetical protein